MLVVLLYGAAVLGSALLLRFIWVVSIGRPPVTKRRKDGEVCKVAVFLGSGGHTSEMMQLVRSLPVDRYTSRSYILTDQDPFSMNKALEFEKAIAHAHALDSSSSSSSLLSSSSGKERSKGNTFDFIHLPRARNVHQAWLSTPISVLYAFAISAYYFVIRGALQGVEMYQHDVLLMNGPGTCVPIVAAIYLLRILGWKSPRLIYIESFARVSSLSLTGKILRWLVDRFIVQWPSGNIKGADYRGVLV